MKERVLSGVRSTGNLHLGNYFGAIKNFIQMQEDPTLESKMQAIETFIRALLERNFE